MADQGIPQTVPGEEMKAEGEVDLSAGEPEVFGDPIVAGDTPQPRPGAEDVGDVGPEGMGGVGGPEVPEEPAGFLDTKWPADAKLPEEFVKYDTPAKLIAAHRNAVSKIGERSDELQQLRTDNKALREGKQTEAMEELRERAEAEIGEGGLKRDTIDALSQTSGWPAAIVAAFGRYMVKQTNAFNEKAAVVFGSADRLQEFLEAIQKGQFSGTQLQDWNAQATEGDLSWIVYPAKTLGFEIDRAALMESPNAQPAKGAAEPSPGVNRIVQQVPVGEAPGPAPGPDVFTSRAEYLTASSIAEANFQESGDSSEKDAVHKKLHRSPTKDWGPQIGG